MLPNLKKSSRVTQIEFQNKNTCFENFWSLFEIHDLREILRMYVLTPSLSLFPNWYYTSGRRYHFVKLCIIATFEVNLKG